jgi:hypothetical protein
MADFFQLISMMREQMNATLSRSDVLKPLAWLVGILATATTVALFASPPEWVLVYLVVTLIVTIGLYALAYLFCLFVDRDALRSEKYSLQKMAIEHGIYGDSRVGLIDPTETKPKLIPPSDTVTTPGEGTT